VKHVNVMILVFSGKVSRATMRISGVREPVESFVGDNNDCRGKYEIHYSHYLPYMYEIRYFTVIVQARDREFISDGYLRAE